MLHRWHKRICLSTPATIRKLVFHFLSNIHYTSWKKKVLNNYLIIYNYYSLSHVAFDGLAIISSAPRISSTFLLTLPTFSPSIPRNSCEQSSPYRLLYTFSLQIIWIHSSSVFRLPNQSIPNILLDPESPTLFSVLDF